MNCEIFKKKRSPNFTPAEIKLFVDVFLPKFKEVIECKKTDAQTRQEKNKAWVQLAQEFNSLSGGFPRTEENLKNLWGELKKKARKSSAFQRKEILGTGGGVRNNSGDRTAVDLQVLAVIGPSGVGLINHFDGDGASTEAAALCEIFTEVVEAEALQPSDDGQKEVSEPAPEAPELNWAQVVSRHMYAKKPEALRVGGPSLVSPCTSTPTSSTSSTDSARKRTVAEELEYAKIMKRRRPSISSATVPDENQAKLIAAKLELTLATKASLEDKQRRDQELFEIEKRRKVSEAQLAELQVLKMKKELGLID